MLLIKAPGKGIVLECPEENPLLADLLQRLELEQDAYDVDVLLLYDQSTPLAQLKQAAQGFVSQGLSVSVQKVKPDGLRFKTLAKFNGSEVQIIENDA